MSSFKVTLAAVAMAASALVSAGPVQRQNTCTFTAQMWQTTEDFGPEFSVSTGKGETYKWVDCNSDDHEARYVSCDASELFGFDFFLTGDSLAYTTNATDLITFTANGVEYGSGPLNETTALCPYKFYEILPNREPLHGMETTCTISC